MTPRSPFPHPPRLRSGPGSGPSPAVVPARHLQPADHRPRAGARSRHRFRLPAPAPGAVLRTAPAPAPAASPSAGSCATHPGACGPAPGRRLPPAPGYQFLCRPRPRSSPRVQHGGHCPPVSCSPVPRRPTPRKPPRTPRWPHTSPTPAHVHGSRCHRDAHSASGHGEVRSSGRRGRATGSPLGRPGRHCAGPAGPWLCLLPVPVRRRPPAFRRPVSPEHHAR